MVYETAITANDHMLTAKSKLEMARQEIKKIVQEQPQDQLLNKFSMKWRKGIPDSLYVPTMAGIPTSLFEQIRKMQF